MKKFSRRKYSKRKLPLLALAFAVLAIPLTVYALLNLESLDTRNRAAVEEPILNSCVISFPYVNPASVEVGKTVQVQVIANIEGEAITKVNIMERSGDVLFEKDYTEGNDTISEIFLFSPEETGDYGMLGTVTTAEDTTKPCVLEGNRSVRALSSNVAPEFKTQPTAAKPSNAIKVGDTYEYLMQVEDLEGDTINWAFSFTPDQEWFKYTVVEDGGEGKLTIKFAGIPTEPASYLANIFVHDGYNQHLRAQTWVISVAQDKNDIPQVTVYSPSEETTVKQGETIKVSWEGTDLNNIVKYELYIASNPGNQNSWTAIDTNLSSKVGNYIFDTSLTNPGTYQFIVRATDNGTPAETGTGISPKVIIGSASEPEEPDEETPDDGIVLLDPQVINISPSNNSKLKNKYPVISATLIAGTESEIESDSIVMVVDDKDVSKDLKINEISEGEFTVIYTTEQEYKAGAHKVDISFEDSSGNKAEKSWTFSVVEEEESSDTYNIFGFEIPKRTALIIGAGLGILLLALIVPWLLYLAWRGSKEDDYESIYESTSPVIPSSPPFAQQPEPPVSAPADKEELKKLADELSTPDVEPEQPGETFTAPSPASSTQEVHTPPPAVEVVNTPSQDPNAPQAQ